MHYFSVTFSYLGWACLFVCFLLKKKVIFLKNVEALSNHK